MDHTHFKVEEMFGNIIGKDKSSQDQVIKPKIFLAEIM